MDEAFNKQVTRISEMYELEIMWGFNIFDMSQKTNITKNKMTSMFLIYVESNFLPQKVEEPTRGGLLISMKMNW